MSAESGDQPDVVARVLELLRRLGWELGVRRLEAELRDYPAESCRGVKELFLGWMAAERGETAAAEAHLAEAARRVPGLWGWAHVARAFLALRAKRFEDARAAIDAAAGAEEAAPDPALRATVRHLTGTLRYHQGADFDEVRALLMEALRLYGPDHFANGRVIDTLGMLYANRDNFDAAQALYHKAVELKRRHEDWAGLAVSYGQLGRLYLDWGLPGQARKFFHDDLEVCRRLEDTRGEAQMQNALGLVALAQGRPGDAAERLDECIDLCLGHGDRAALEGYARKDKALALLALGDAAAAEEECERARGLFASIDFREGLAHVRRALGQVRRAQERWKESLDELTAARRFFGDNGEPAEEARALLEVALTRRAANEPALRVREAFKMALQAAERCRRSHLVRAAEEGLRAVHAASAGDFAFRRVRGRGAPADTASLTDGAREPASVLYLDLAGSTELAAATDPALVLLSLNQMMAELTGVLRDTGALVSGFRGDGFLALFTGQDHAARAVRAGLDLHRAVAAFNEPREVVGQEVFVARVGIATGGLILGNMGTYDKMDYTAIGTAANLGARLQQLALPGSPCVCQTTYQAVHGRFRFREGEGYPRRAELKGLTQFGPQPVYDVLPPDETAARAEASR